MWKNKWSLSLSCACSIVSEACTIIRIIVGPDWRLRSLGRITIARKHRSVLSGTGKLLSGNVFPLRRNSERCSSFGEGVIAFVGVQCIVALCCPITVEKCFSPRMQMFAWVMNFQIVHGSTNVCYSILRMVEDQLWLDWYPNSRNW